MDQQNKQQRRVSFSDLLHGKHQINKERMKSKSFRAGSHDEAMEKMIKGYNGKESEFAATIAAAAYAIHSLDETRAEYERLMVESFRKSFRASPTKPPSTKDLQGTFELPTRGSSRVERKSGDEGITRSSTRLLEVEGSLNRSGIRGETKADAWEQARIAKINKWYEKMNCKILEWENEKKKKASLDMEKRKAELERLKRVNLYHYQNKIDWIKDASEGARKQLEEKKRSEEAYVKQRANKIRSTGTVPVQCFCFEY